MAEVTVIQPHEQVLLVVVQKRFLDEASAHQLVDDVLTVAAQVPSVPIVLDMSQVRFAPSAALGSLVRLSKSFKLDGRRLALIGVDDRVFKAIQVTRLDAILEIHDSLDQVVGTTPDKP